MTGVVLGAVLPLLEVLPEAMGWGEKMGVVNELESTLRPRGGAEEHGGGVVLRGAGVPRSHAAEKGTPWGWRLMSARGRLVPLKH